MEIEDCDCRYCIANATRLVNDLLQYSAHPHEMTRLEILCESKPRKKHILPLFDLAVTRALDYVTKIVCCKNHLDDDIGMKIADLIEKSQVLTEVYIHGNSLTSKTMLAIARALQVNTSVKTLHIYDNLFCITPRIRTMLIGALWLNPNRPINSDWRLYSHHPDFITLRKYKEIVKELSHPSLQMILVLLNRKMTIRGRDVLSPVRRIE